MSDEVDSITQVAVAAEDLPETDSNKPSSTAYLWVMLIARIYEICPLICPQCGGELKIVAFLTEADPIQRILTHIDEPTTPPRIAPARAPPDWLEADFDRMVLNDPEQAEPLLEFEFDQTVNWYIFRVHFSIAVPIAQWDWHRCLIAFGTDINFSAVISTDERTERCHFCHNSSDFSLQYSVCCEKRFAIPKKLALKFLSIKTKRKVLIKSKGRKSVYSNLLILI